MIRAQKSRGLAVSTDKRMKALPDVPTFKELDIGESVTLTRSFWGPPKLPANFVDIIARAVEKACKDAQFVKLIEDEFLYTVEFRPGTRILEDLKTFDKVYGPILAETNK